MSAAAGSPFGGAQIWQPALDRNAEIFSGMVPGAAVGFVARSGSGLQPGKHVGGLEQAGGSGEMLVWEMGEHGMRAQLRTYTGFQQGGIDLLFVAEEAAIAAMHGARDSELLSQVKRLIRSGAIMFYVMRTKYELQDAGYEDFLDTLGLAFLGACR
jgi:hypothetical protein